MNNEGSYSCCASSSLVQLVCRPDVFRMTTSGLRDFTQKPYFESSGQVRLNSSGCHAVRAGAFQYSSVVAGDTREFKNVFQCPNTTPPPASDNYSF